MVCGPPWCCSVHLWLCRAVQPFLGAAQPFFWCWVALLWYTGCCLVLWTLGSSLSQLLLSYLSFFELLWWIFPVEVNMSSSISNLPVVNIKTLVPLELTDFIYLVWKQVFLNVLKSFGVTSYVDGIDIIPSQTIDATDKKVIINPDYLS